MPPIRPPQDAKALLDSLRLFALLMMLLATTGCLGLFGRDRDAQVDVTAVAVEKPAPAGKRSPAPPSPRQPKPKSVSTEKATALQEEYELGVQAYDADRPAEAVERLSAVYLEMPGHGEVKSYLKRAYIALGMEHYTRGEIGDSIQVWKKILLVDPSDERARAYIRKAQDEMARLPLSAPASDTSRR